jgi:hypothetical protein
VLQPLRRHLAPPYLHAPELWERVGFGGTITEADYEAIGGVDGSVRRRADGLMAELAREGKSELVIATLLELTAIDASGALLRPGVAGTTPESGLR